MNNMHFFFLRSFQENYKIMESCSPFCEILDLQLQKTDNIKKLYPEALDKSFISWLVHLVTRTVFSERVAGNSYTFLIS